MHWLLERLEEIGKTPTELARHLGVGKQRLYAIYTPDKKTKKTRKIQPGEWEPIAAFLGWTLKELHDRAAGAVVADRGTSVSLGGAAIVTDRPNADGLKFRSIRAKQDRWEGFMLYADEPISQTPKAFEINVLDDKNEPVYRLRDTLVIDPNYPITLEEDCVFTTSNWPPKGGFCIIARLIRDTATTWFCKAIASGEAFELDRAEFPNAWAIIGRRRPAL
jgi:hypothetical protein